MKPNKLRGIAVQPFEGLRVFSDATAIITGGGRSVGGHGFSL